jgi:hypothetical protein
LDDRDQLYFEEDGNLIYCSQLSQLRHLTCVQRVYLEFLNQKFEIAKATCDQLKEIRYKFYIYFLLVLLFSTPLSLLAISIKSVLLKVLVFSCAFAPILGFLGSLGCYLT